ncbi:tRNA (N6-isopentenyl adenosine(37)-C2)-methylthiotransferase MiaB [Candidatus Babeliales bacterium]|nr:tRNA (N6-isopentenyl adenosine(37)-C2)-methylthiotransferase MiaB [Candidatus Babeliales bacterium]MBY0353627.1 tRNA (N6-isopentenyl adenosine(37)-C2)-methylthiotransferase MiaB [Candidatus Babeliales bacterium]
MITFFFKTYGCQANVADSEEIAKFLKSLGCDDVPTEEEADLLIVNTCAVRDKAEQKLFSYLGRLSDIKRQSKPYVNIGVIGCVASYKKEEIYKRFDQVNFVYGAREDMKTFLAYLTDMVVKLETKKQLRNDEPETIVKSGGQDRNVKQYVQSKGLFSKAMPLFKKRLYDVKPFKTEKEMVASFINIMTGCNKFCKYCIVPFTRGREISYDMTEIIERVKHDIACGVKEITLIGQNVNSYRDPQTGADFSELLRRVAAIEGEFWVRWVSPHPQDMTMELFDVIAQHRDKIPPYVHFPVQSGSTRMLFEMGRNHTIELYLEQIEWLRSRLPDATISTDLIVGYPGETEEDYNQTMALLEKVRYDLVYSFIYSPRNYTPAAKLTDSTPAEVKTQRLEALQERQRVIARAKNDAHIGKIMKSLVEKRLPNGKLLARTEGNVRVLFDGDDALISSFVNLKINEAGVANMLGTLV